jgi:hypothetical protein
VAVPGAAPATHVIRKGSMQNDGGTKTAAEQFYSLVM